MKMIMLCKECLVEPVIDEVKNAEGSFLYYDLTWTCPVCRKQLGLADVTQMPAAKYRKLDRERYLKALKGGRHG